MSLALSCKTVVSFSSPEVVSIFLSPKDATGANLTSGSASFSLDSESSLAGALGVALPKEVLGAPKEAEEEPKEPEEAEPNENAGAFVSEFPNTDFVALESVLVDAGVPNRNGADLFSVLELPNTNFGLESELGVLPNRNGAEAGAEPEAEPVAAVEVAKELSAAFLSVFSAGLTLPKLNRGLDASSAFAALPKENGAAFVVSVFEPVELPKPVKENAGLAATASVALLDESTDAEGFDCPKLKAGAAV